MATSQQSYKELSVEIKFEGYYKKGTQSYRDSEQYIHISNLKNTLIYFKR